jgi:hypothetical protein
VQITYQDTNLTTPGMTFILSRSDRYPYHAISHYISPAEFRNKIVPTLAIEVDHCRKGSYIIEQALSQFGKGDMEEEYEKEMSPRWRAWYDLNRGRLLAMSVRHREYMLTCEAILKNLTSLKPDTNRLVFHPSKNYRSGYEIEARAREALRLLARCMSNNRDTPWEWLAKWELDHDLGLSVEEIAIPAPKPSPPSRGGPSRPPPPATPAPTFTIPRL